MTDEIIEDEKLSKVYIGTIIKSMLPKNAFMQINGRRFQLCDGLSAVGTDYEALTGRTNVPDLRGLFVRQQGDNSADLGDIQDASINKDHFEININWNQSPNQEWTHSHKILSRVGVHPSTNIGANQDGCYQSWNDQPDEEQFIFSTAPDKQRADAGVTDSISVNAKVPDLVATQPAGIKVSSDIQGPTRPINIALYYYICVWEDEPEIPDDIHDDPNHNPNPITCEVVYVDANPVTDNFRMIPTFRGEVGSLQAIRQVTNAPLPFVDAFSMTKKLRDKLESLQDFKNTGDIPETKIDFDDLVDELELVAYATGEFSESYLEKISTKVSGPLGNIEKEIVMHGNCDIHVRGQSNNVYRFKMFPFERFTNLDGDKRECLQMSIWEVYYLNLDQKWQKVTKQDDKDFITVDCFAQVIPVTDGIFDIDYVWGSEGSIDDTLPTTDGGNIND